MMINFHHHTKFSKIKLHGGVPRHVEAQKAVVETAFVCFWGGKFWCYAHLWFICSPWYRLP